LICVSLFEQRFQPGQTKTTLGRDHFPLIFLLSLLVEHRLGKVAKEAGLVTSAVWVEGVGWSEHVGLASCWALGSLGNLVYKGL
jgi:hypothetical protein